MYDTTTPKEIQELARKTACNSRIIHWLSDKMPLASQAAMEHCGDYLVFLENENRDKRKLELGYFCKQRLCSGCAWRASIKAAQCVAAISAAMTEEHKIMLMITLTVPNCKGYELKATMRKINSAWSKLLRRKRYAPWADYIRKMEITYNSQTNSYHPHLHCIVYVSAGYFARQYIPHDQLLEDWRSVCQDASITQVDLRRCKHVREGTSAILEVSKYAAKASDFAFSRQTARTFYAALKHARLMEYGGECKDLLDKFKAGELSAYEQLDATEYTLRVIYVYNRIAQAYSVHEIQQFDMDAAELARLQANEERLAAYAISKAERAQEWKDWLRTDWVRELLAKNMDDLEVIE